METSTLSSRFQRLQKITELKKADKKWLQAKRADLIKDLAEHLKTAMPPDANHSAERTLRRDAVGASRGGAVERSSADHELGSPGHTSWLEQILSSARTNWLQFFEKHPAALTTPGYSLLMIWLPSGTWTSRGTSPVAQQFSELLFHCVVGSHLIRTPLVMVSSDPIPSAVLESAGDFAETLGARVWIEGGVQPAEALFLAQHPAVDKVVVHPQWPLLSLQDLPVLKKPVVANVFSHQTRVVLKDADLDPVVLSLVAEWKSQPVSAFFRTHRVLVAESVYKDFLQRLENQIKDQPVLALSDGERAAMSEIKQRALTDQGYKAFDREDFILIRDLPYCSTLHQEMCAFPGFLTASFKYNFDAVDAINTSKVDGRVSIWSGTSDSFQAVATKLNVRDGIWNGGFDSLFLDRRLSLTAPYGFGHMGGFENHHVFFRRQVDDNL